MALTSHDNRFTCILQSIALKPSTYPPATHRSVGCTSAHRSNEQRRATLFTKYYRAVGAVAQNAQGQGVQAWRSEPYISSQNRDEMLCSTTRFFTSATRERLCQRAKVKAHKLGGVRRASVRRSNEQCRATPRLALWHKRSGFSYLGVLILVAAMSISLVGAGRYWSTIVKRELEAELLFRGDQIRKAIASYYDNPPEGQDKTYPHKFNDLVKDSRYPYLKRHLRRWYTDPMASDGEWVYVMDASQRLKGVHSSHPGVPLKKGNFLREHHNFENAQTYADWVFVYIPKK